MDENTKICILALLNVVTTLAGYYFGYRRGNNLNNNLKGKEQ